MNQETRNQRASLEAAIDAIEEAIRCNATAEPGTLLALAIARNQIKRLLNQHDKDNQ